MSNWEVVKDDSAGIHVINICTDLYKIRISNYQMLHTHTHMNTHTYTYTSMEAYRQEVIERSEERERTNCLSLYL